MTIVDWVIVVVIVISVLGGLGQGFFRSVCSLGGLILGLAIAAWNYGRLAPIFLGLVKVDAIADAIAFILIAVLVMALVGAIGSVLAKAFKQIGLGFLDRLAGGAFGFFQGALFVTLCILVAVAFFPKAEFLTESRLPKMFFGACHLSTHMSPRELADRVRRGLKTLEEKSPQWLHPGEPNGE